jgi:hypothetical protein
MVARPKAYLNVLAEEGTRQELINWLVKLDGEVDDLTQDRSDQAAEFTRQAQYHEALVSMIQAAQSQLHFWKTFVELPSYKWMEFPEFKDSVVMDPDGWDRQNFQSSWDEEICYEEFLSRYMRSTVVRRAPRG